MSSVHFDWILVPKVSLMLSNILCQECHSLLRGMAVIPFPITAAHCLVAPRKTSVLMSTLENQLEFCQHKVR